MSRIFGAVCQNGYVVRDIRAAMEHWVIGNLEWSFETNRYFGAEHARVKESLVVVLLPREHAHGEEARST